MSWFVLVFYYFIIIQKVNLHEYQQSLWKYFYNPWTGSWPVNICSYTLMSGISLVPVLKIHNVSGIVLLTEWSTNWSFVLWPVCSLLLNLLTLLRLVPLKSTHRLHQRLNVLFHLSDIKLGFKTDNYSATEESSLRQNYNLCCRRFIIYRGCSPVNFCVYLKCVKQERCNMPVNFLSDTP